MLGFRGDQRGGVAVYSAITLALGVAGGALAIDFGRLSLVREQMQDSADAAALAAAVFLNGQDDARTRAENVARNAMVNASGVSSDDGTDLAVANVKFYSAYTPTPVDATSDIDAKFVEVELAPRGVNMLFTSVLKLFSGTGAATETLHAKAVAGVTPFVCHAPPLMMCDLAEEDPLMDPMDPANIGKQVVLKEPQGGGSWAPGNFGLLALPDGSSGASDVSQALAAETPQDCYQIDVITAQGSKTNKVKDGINTRFDISPMPDPPAPNVIHYSRDDVLIADPNAKLGDGVWDLNGYWDAKHGDGVAPPEAPPAPLADATRYQVYLYELGEKFARLGRETIYPVPADPSTLPTGFVVVDPLGVVNIPTDATDPTNPAVDGVPQNTPASNGPARRLVEVALLQCVADNIHGHGTHPTYGRYVEMFITESVQDPPNAAIYGEIVRPLSAVNDPEFHANSALVE